MTTTKGDQQHQPASFEDLFISEIHRDDLDLTPKDDDNDDLLLLGTGGYGEQYEEADMRALYAAAAALPRPRNSPVSLSAVPPSRTAPWATYFALEDDFDGARDTAASSREPPELEVLHGETLAQRLEVSVLSDLTGEDAAQRHPEELLVLQESDNLALRTRVQVPSVRLDRTVPKTAALWTRAMSVEMEKTFRFEDPVSENLSDAVVEEGMKAVEESLYQRRGLEPKGPIYEIDAVPLEVIGRGLLTESEIDSARQGRELELEGAADLENKHRQSGNASLRYQPSSRPTKMHEHAVFQQSRDDQFIYRQSLTSLELTEVPVPLGTFDEFHHRDLLTQSELESQLTQSLFEDDHNFAQSEEPILEVTLAEYWAETAPSAFGSSPIVTAEIWARSTLSAEDLRRISETAETISVDLEASSDEDLEEETKLVDKIIEESPAARERSEGVIRDMYATVNPGTGAVASEEILDVLLSEARRIQWDRASQEGVSGPEPQQARSSPKRGAPVAQGDAAAKQAGRNLLREVYKQAAVGQDGGVDPDAALSIVLNEALRLIENRKRSQPKPDHELAALKKVKSKL